MKPPFSELGNKVIHFCRGKKYFFFKYIIPLQTFFKIPLKTPLSPPPVVYGTNMDCLRYMFRNENARIGKDCDASSLPCLKLPYESETGNCVIEKYLSFS